MKEPRYYEIEELRRAGSRKLWVAVGVLGTTTVLALLVAAAAILRPLPVIAFDAAGRPILFTDTATPALETTKVRVDWFVRHFLEKYIAIDSTRLDDDLTEGLNMMTPGLRAYVIADGKEIARRQKYKGSNVRSSLANLELRIGEFDPKSTASIFVYCWGRHVFEPIFGSADQDKVERFVFGKLRLDRSPVTKQVPHGLLVHLIEWKAFDTEAELTAELLKLQLQGGSSNAH